MTCQNCKHFEECLNEAMALNQVFDPEYDGEHHCGANKFEPREAAQAGEGGRDAKG